MAKQFNAQEITKICSDMYSDLARNGFDTNFFMLFPKDMSSPLMVRFDFSDDLEKEAIINGCKIIFKDKDCYGWGVISEAWVTRALLLGKPIQKNDESKPEESYVVFGYNTINEDWHNKVTMKDTGEVLVSTPVMNGYSFNIHLPEFYNSGAEREPGEFMFELEVMPVNLEKLEELLQTPAETAASRMGLH